MNELIVKFEPQLLNVSAKENVIRGVDGKDGKDGQDGAPGAPGQDGVSPEVSVESITGGHAVTITDADHPAGQTFNVMDGQDGQPGPAGPAGQNGAPGADGVSPEVTIGTITGGHSVTITDAQGSETFNVMDGDDGSPGPAGPGVPTGGTSGQYLKKASGTDYDTAWDTMDAGDVEYDDTETYSSGTVGAEVSGLKNSLNSKVDKSGDTMTGELRINDNNFVIKNGTADITAASIPSSQNNWFRIYDKNGRVLGNFDAIQSTNGSTSARMYARNQATGSGVDNTLSLAVNTDGTRSVSVSSPTPWRSALGLGTNGALPITPAQGGTGKTSLDTFFVDRETTISTAPSSVNALMNYAPGTYRISISGSQSVIPISYGIMEVIHADIYGLIRLTKINSSTATIYIRSFRVDTKEWYETNWISAT